MLDSFNTQLSLHLSMRTWLCES